MSLIKNFETIICWKESRLLNQRMGEMIDQKRFDQNFRLINQIERSAGSIMDNIAEGFERGGNREFIQFMYIAKASCGEFRSQLYRALDRKYITPTEFEELSIHTRKINFLIQQFINYLSSSKMKGHKYKQSPNP